MGQTCDTRDGAMGLRTPAAPQEKGDVSMNSPLREEILKELSYLQTLTVGVDGVVVQ